jgi:hypothetical protein
MRFLENLKAKRAAKKAQQKYELELTQWQEEERILTNALDIFTSAAEGKEPDDQSLVQKDGEFVIWTGNAIFHEAPHSITLRRPLLRFLHSHRRRNPFSRRRTWRNSRPRRYLRLARQRQKSTHCFIRHHPKSLA